MIGISDPPRSVSPRHPFSRSTVTCANFVVTHKLFCETVDKNCLESFPGSFDATHGSLAANTRSRWLHFPHDCTTACSWPVHLWVPPSTRRQLDEFGRLALKSPHLAPAGWLSRSLADKKCRGVLRRKESVQNIKFSCETFFVVSIGKKNNERVKNHKLYGILRRLLLHRLQHRK